MKILAKSAVLVAAAAAAATASPYAMSGSTGTTGSAKFNYTVPGHLTTQVDSTSYCDNTGPHITFTSSLTIGSHAMQIAFKNNVKGTHTYTVTGTATMSLFNAADGTQPAQVAKQPPLGGVGGNPYLYLRVDGAAQDIYLGRCVQDFGAGTNNGRGPFNVDASLAGVTSLALHALSCGSTGSQLSVGTDSNVDGATGHLVLTNNYVDLNGVTPHINDSDIIASVGFGLTGGFKVPKQGNVGGPGGNPLVAGGTGVWSNTDPNAVGVNVGNAFSPDAALQDLGRCKDL